MYKRPSRRVPVRALLATALLVVAASCNRDSGPVQPHAGADPAQPFIVDPTPRTQMPPDRVLEALGDRSLTRGTMFVALKEAKAVRGVGLDGARPPVEARIHAGAAVREAFPDLKVIRGVVRPIYGYGSDGRLHVDTLYRMRLTVQAPTSIAYLERLIAHPNVDYVEPNYSNGELTGAKSPIVEISAAGALRQTPTQWESWGLDAVRAEIVWDEGYTGNGANIGFMDSGADLFGANHPDLDDFGYIFWNPTMDNADNNCQNPATQACVFEGPYDGNDGYHGTGVLGTLMATDNSQGSVGIAPYQSASSSLLYKVWYDPDGSDDSELDEDAMIEAVEFIADNWDSYSVDVRVAVTAVNFPGTSISDSASHQSLHDAFKTTSSENNVLWFAAAGNNDGDPATLPSAFPEVVAVGSVDSSLQRSSFSAISPEVELVAPGENVRVSWNRSDDLPGAYQYTQVVDGTSFAAPAAAGVARLALDKNPTWTASTLRSEMQSHARDLGANGKDNLYGYGLVDAYCLIAQHDPCVPLTMYMTGQSNIQSEGYYTYESFPTGGGGSFSYSWKECSPSCSTVSTSKTYTRWVAETDPHFDLFVTVNGSDPDAVADTLYVFNNIDGGPEAPPLGGGRRGGGK